jgi:hypothetical protein
MKNIRNLFAKNENWLLPGRRYRVVRNLREQGGLGEGATDFEVGEIVEFRDVVRSSYDGFERFSFRVVAKPDEIRFVEVGYQQEKPEWGNFFEPL